MSLEIYPRKLQFHGQINEVLSETMLLVNSSASSVTVAAIGLAGASGVVSITSPPALPLTMTAGQEQILTIAATAKQTADLGIDTKLVVTDSLGNVSEASVGYTRTDDGGLRYEVVATEPPEPNENTVWIDTSVTPSRTWQYRNGLWVGATMTGANANKFIVNKHWAVRTETDLGVVASSGMTAPTVAPTLQLGAAGSGTYMQTQNRGLVAAFIHRRFLPSGGGYVYSTIGPYNIITNGSAQYVSLTISGTVANISGYEIGCLINEGSSTAPMEMASFKPLNGSYSYYAATSVQYQSQPPSLPPALRLPKFYSLGTITSAASIDAVQVEGGLSVFTDVLNDAAATRVMAGIGVCNAGITDGTIGKAQAKEVGVLGYADALVYDFTPEVFANTATNTNVAVLISIGKNDAELDCHAAVRYAHVKYPMQSLTAKE